MTVKSAEDLRAARLFILVMFLGELALLCWFSRQNWRLYVGICFYGLLSSLRSSAVDAVNNYKGACHL